MKTLLAVFLLVSLCEFAVAQQPGIERDPKRDQEKIQIDAALAAAGCGPAETYFDVKTDKKQHPSGRVEEGKALVYVFEEDISGGEATTRVGLDGKWMGANRAQAYFFFSADPGEHRLCTNWQEKYAWLARLGTALTFTAEAGKTYYFRTMITARKGYAVRLERLDTAEGQFLISGDGLSSAHPRKPEPAK
jgi:hypothetical protein